MSCNVSGLCLPFGFLLSIPSDKVPQADDLCSYPFHLNLNRIGKLYGLTRISIRHAHNDIPTTNIKRLALNLMVVGAGVRAAAVVVQNILRIAGEQAGIDRHQAIVIVAGVDGRAVLTLDAAALGPVERHGGQGDAAASVLLAVAVVGGLEDLDVAEDLELAWEEVLASCLELS